MPLRIVFELADLQRVRLTDRADPMWELALGLITAQTRAIPEPSVGWRQQLNRRLTGANQDAMSLLCSLIPPAGPFPDFLTPPGPATDLDAGCEAIACTPRDLLDADLATVFAGRATPTWIRLLAGGDREVIGEVVRAIRRGHDLLVAPRSAEIREVVVADHAMRTRQVVNDGVGALLANLPGVLGWDGRVLRLRYPVDRTVRLAGRGLLLLPSYFCWDTPVTLINSELPPILVYPAARAGVSPAADVTIPRHLVPLLGHTRAECLRLLLAPLSTSDLAQHLGTSIGNASKQASVLRDAGLITSTRRGAAVLHATTALGVALLTSSPV